MAPRVRVQTQDFDPAVEQAQLHAGNAAVGAIATFTGLVRASNDGQPVQSMRLEHYPGMTEAAIEAMIDEAMRRFPAITAASVVHRVGLLLPLERVVWVGVASAHREEAFAGCAFLMDYLKTQAPFWKKECTPQGQRWVQARSSDDAALARWGLQARNAAEGD